MPLDDAAIAKFRSQLLEDADFRARFAKAPADALREAGIDVPQDVQLPSINKRELDRRVEALKDAIADDALEKFAAGKAEDVDESVRVQADDLLNFSRRVRPGGAHRAIERDILYTISAFGTVDW
jgi:hypothetical protein